MSTWSKVLLEDANITVGTITPSLTDITTALSADNHGSVELVVLDSNELKTITADFNTGAFNPVTSDTNTMGSGFSVTATTNTTPSTITESDTLLIAASTGITTTASADGTITIANSAPMTGDAFDADGTFSDLRAQGTTKADVGLGSVTNESKATMFASPTFTGTVSGVTKAHVGLGNVEDTALSTYTGQSGALDNQYITNGANYSTLVLGTSSSTALAGDTTILALGTSSSQALAGNTAVDVVSSANLLAGLALLDNGGNIVIGDATDTTVVIAGNLQVTGTTETVSATELKVDDITIAVASGSTSASAANNSGLEVDIDADNAIDANPAILYQSSAATFSDFKMRKSLTAKSDAFVAAMTTAASTGDLDNLTPGVGTLAMVGAALYVQTAV